jgi:hypothetical protein
MQEPYAPRRLYRFQLGFLLLSLPRRFIPGGFRDLSARSADDALP